MKAIFFDFFGTLAHYQPDRTQLTSPGAHEHARSLGFQGDHDAFVETWDAASSELEQSARATLREFSMTDAAAAFARRTGLGLRPNDCERLGRVFVEEWARHVHPIPGVADLIRRLATDVSVAVVSNTHDADMVPTMLGDMGIDDVVADAVLSVDVGWLKPHEAVYQTALERVRCRPSEALFVGDSYTADYVGPRRSGMSALLIDPNDHHGLPAAHRISSVLDLEAMMLR